MEFPDIEPLFKKLGIPPSTKQPDGSPYYTAPAIYDPVTGIYISDSILIAEYLEKTYPDRPPLFPNGTLGLQSAFNDGIFHNIKSVVPAMVPTILSKLNSVSSTYMINKHGPPPPGQPSSAEHWKAFEAGLSQVDTWYARNGGKSLFLLGDKPSWADIVLASFLVYVKRMYGEESSEWKQVASWNGGRWEAHSAYFKNYETVV